MTRPAQSPGVRPPSLARRSLFRAAVAAVALGVGADRGLDAQAPSAPRAVVEESFAALSMRKWDAVAALSSPQFLEQFRKQQLFYAEDDERQRQQKKKGPESYGLPKCVQKYLESQQEDFSKRFLENFAGVENLLQLEVLTPTQLFAAWLAGTKNIRKSDQAAAPNVVIPDRAIVGELVEGDSVAHVLYRRVPSPPEDADGGIKVITLRRSDGVWRIFPNDDMILAGRSFAWWSNK